MKAHSSKYTVFSWLALGATGALAYIFLRDELLLSLPSDRLASLHLLSAVITMLGVGAYFTVRASSESRSWPARKRVALGIVLVGFVGFALFGPSESCVEGTSSTQSSCEALSSLR